MDFVGKVAVVTGSTSGVGYGVAKALAEQGASIVLNGFGDETEIKAMRQEISDLNGGNCIYIAADLSKADEVAMLIRETEEQLGGVDILINNAGIQHVAPVEDFPDEKWEFMLSLMLSAPFYAVKAAVPGMRQRGFGRIVNIASAHGRVASPNKSAYVACKHGLIGLNKVVALETAEDNITSNAICPGWVLTPLVAAQVDAIAERDGLSWDEAKMKLLSEKQPSKEFVTPEQIGAMVLYLCSDAAAQVTGTEMSIDGGWVAV